ncbi:MAG TPA: hypothetical protein VL284_09285 [Thermoanaerobaculia bacterium]|nr:hypothetical protein [Thermoanaerobaculia bacterium]
MISCQSFRENVRSREPEVLEHLRVCDACLDYALSVDPDNFFRAIGGEALMPPGGVDAFTSDVMSQIRLRQAEGSVAHRFLVAPRRLAAAAAIVVAIGTGALVWENRSMEHRLQPVAAMMPAKADAPLHVLTTKPVIETYQSKDATIVEMPSQGKNDANVVMIFDDSLPADL